MLNTTLRHKLQHVRQHIGDVGLNALAFSGGADSSLLLRLAADVLGPQQVLALFSCSDLQPAAELAHVRTIAASIGCQLLEIATKPLAHPAFVSNPPDRCYHCKKNTYSLFMEKLTSYGSTVLMDGTNADDVNDTRPGLRALAQLNIATPLADAGLSKPEVRQLSRDLGLPTWNRPSGSCLATRIPTGRPITSELLASVARCEAYLHSLGFMGCRVRLFPEHAHIELAAGDLARFAGSEAAALTRSAFSSFGVDKVLLDLAQRKG
jgi:uncharacterized protein